METDLNLFTTNSPTWAKYIILPFCNGKHIPVILVALVVVGNQVLSGNKTAPLLQQNT